MADGIAAAQAALQKLAKWRTVLAGWHLGTRAKVEPGVPAMRDLREAVLILQAQQAALAGLLIAKGVFSAEEWTLQLGEEAAYLDRSLEARFPGYSTDETGVRIDAARAARTNAALAFPP